MERGILRPCRPAQQLQLGAKLVENKRSAVPRGPIGQGDGLGRPPCLHDQVDRTVLQMQTPPIGQQPGRQPRHPGGMSGQGVPGCGASSR